MTLQQGRLLGADDAAGPSKTVKKALSLISSTSSTEQIQVSPTVRTSCSVSIEYTAPRSLVCTHLFICQRELQFAASKGTFCGKLCVTDVVTATVVQTLLINIESMLIRQDRGVEV